MQSLFITIAFLKSLASRFPWSSSLHLVLANATKVTNLVVKNSQYNPSRPSLWWECNQMVLGWSLQVIMVCPVPLLRWWQFCSMKNNSLSFFQQSPKASSVLYSGSSTAMQLPLHESHGCLCFNSIANYTHKFREQLIVLWSRCSFGGKKFNL